MVACVGCMVNTSIWGAALRPADDGSVLQHGRASGDACRGGVARPSDQARSGTIFDAASPVTIAGSRRAQAASATLPVLRVELLGRLAASVSETIYMGSGEGAEPVAGEARGRERRRRISRMPSTSGVCGDYALTVDTDLQPLEERSLHPRRQVAARSGHRRAYERDGRGESERCGLRPARHFDRLRARSSKQRMASVVQPW